MQSPSGIKPGHMQPACSLGRRDRPMIATVAGPSDCGVHTTILLPASWTSLSQALNSETGKAHVALLYIPTEPPVLWATSADSGQQKGSSDPAFKVVGAPIKQVLRLTSCNERPSAALGYSPSTKKGAPAPIVAVGFEGNPAKTVAETQSVGIYFVYLGALNPIITRVTLLVVPRGGTAKVAVPIFVATTDPAPAYNCPGLTYFTFSASFLASRSSALTAAGFSTATVVGAQFDFNGTPVDTIDRLAVVAAVGLILA
ncbi:hypothetical protein VOLCADRAFT_107822 [Volvox carteri f. nagariensis]|uniref:Uncharacterized protein n=1 Tax=Volvox carteri f. nagariensis TaxID=3068 RepID=D8UGP1_VOLCA|nr:uncharacterized protein VOLCADRAFT_107822 [Volvox carteri f. nagariensis]EFJ41155.1 hypothetical protein VOLCADRAFT_107822 [Volvox carteri f. nagariensis]|eukprot:XP_002957827.1 hypothetical protein VOLCADRAFT_107822 [Volvox carteri f. nagariensis]